MDLRQLGKRIKERRVYLGLKQADIAEAIGTSRANYARYEAGDVDINVTTLEALAGALRVSKRYLDPDGDEWAPEGDVAAFFTGAAPDELSVARATIEAMQTAKRQAERVHGRKAE